MLAAWVRREEIKEAREKGRIEGRAEARIEEYAEGYAEGWKEGRALERKAWQEWLKCLDAWEQRKSHAKNLGQDFQEPRPTPPA